MLFDVLARSDLEEFLSGTVDPLPVLNLLFLGSFINKRVCAEPMLLALAPVAPVDLAVGPSMDSKALLEIVNVLTLV